MEKAKEKVDKFLERKELEGKMYDVVLDDFELSIAPYTNKIGRNLIFLSTILFIPFYFFQWETTFWMFPVNTSLITMLFMFGTVLKLRTDQLLQGTEDTQEIATNTAKQLLNQDDDMPDIDKEVEEMLKEEKSEEVK